MLTACLSTVATSHLKLSSSSTRPGTAKYHPRARAIHDQLLPVTKSVYHRGSHMEGAVALKHTLVARDILEHATVRSPLLPLPERTDIEIWAAVKQAQLPKLLYHSEFEVANSM
jgi:4-hydroxy-tetrahydrodipicolinate synthase